jgi:uncharacterized protein (UPF0333 family)
MSNKRGQAAMEFLMTYGWAIVVVLAAIGALAYFGVLSPGNLLPDKTSFKAPLIGTDASITANAAGGVINIPLTNNKGARVEINSVTASGDCTANTTEISVQGGVFAVVANQSVSNGQVFNLRITCVEPLVAGDKFASDIAIQYTDPATYLQKTHPGTVQGSVS